MAVSHQVWMKFAAEVSPDRIEAHLNALRGLRGQVPGIIDLNVGKNFTDRAHGFTHGLLVVLRDKQGLTDYQVHPRHVEVATALKADAQLMAMDYEF
jgi:hypothetical protein